MYYFYIRVSNSNVSQSNQKFYINKYIQDNNIKDYEIITDVSEGFIDSNENMLFGLINTMNSDDVFCTYNISRISRHGENLRKFFELANEKELKTIFIFDSDERQIIEKSNYSLSFILSNITEINTQYISLVAKNALKELKEKGIKLGHPKVYGESMARKVKSDYQNGYTMMEIAAKYNISVASVHRIIRNKNQNQVINKSNVNNIPMEIKLSIWADRKMGKTTTELSNFYNLDKSLIHAIPISLKGGAHW